MVEGIRDGFEADAGDRELNCVGKCGILVAWCFGVTGHMTWERK